MLRVRASRKDNPARDAPYSCNLRGFLPTYRQHVANSVEGASDTNGPLQRTKPRLRSRKSLRFRPTSFDLMLGASTLIYLTIVLLWLYSLYTSGEFAYHDLTLISDFFSNGLVHGRPFWINETEENHLKLHFTPSLVFLMPLFALFNSQFALIALAATGVCVSIFVATREQYLSLLKLDVPLVWRWIISAGFFAAFAGNRYTLRNLSSAHFEPFFMPAAMFVVCAIRHRVRLRWLVVALLLALGMRQDAGFFMFFLLGSCLAAPRTWGRVPRKTLVASGLFCVAYFVLVATVVQPWLGNNGSTRFWHEWGNTWPEVLLAWLSSPVRVWHAVESSEFFSFNFELLWLPALSPLAWLTNQLPGILFYTADAWDKHLLRFCTGSA